MEIRETTDDSVLLGRPWVPVCISESQFLAKTWFGDTAYHIVLTDLHSAWEEKMDSLAIQERAQELNKRLRAPVQAFFSHLHEVAEPCLSGQGGGETEGRDGEASITLTHQGSSVSMMLKSKLASLPFYWEFRCTPAPLALVCSQLVRPLLSMSRLLQRQVNQLGALLVRKDLEIQEYRENGAVLSRERLQTEVFDERSYRESFFSQALPQVAVPQDGLGFDPELQELYTAIAAERVDAGIRKRKRSEQHAEDGGGPTPPGRHAEPSPGCVASQGGAVRCAPGQGDEVEASAADRPTSPQTGPPTATAPVQPTSSKPKKKKAKGLFR